MADVFNFYVRDDRKIDFYSPEPIMQEDKDVAVWRFRIPKVLNQVDMTNWAWWFVYENAKGEKYSEALMLSDDIDEPGVYSTAEISVGHGMSMHPGNISFALEAIEAIAQVGTIVAEWHTKTYSHKVIGTLQGNQAEYAETEHDIISALITEYQNLHVGTNQITDGAVTFAKLANDAVTSVKIVDGAVTNGKLASNSVSTANMQDGAITEAKLNTPLKYKVDRQAIINVASVVNGVLTSENIADAITDSLEKSKYIYIPSGDYTFNVEISQDCTIYLDSDCYISTDNTTPVIYAHDCSFNLIGGNVYTGADDDSRTPIASSRGIIFIENCHDSSVRNINSPYSKSNGVIWIHDCENFILEQSSFSNMLRAAMFIWGSCKNVTVRNCRFENSIPLEGQDFCYFVYTGVLTFSEISIPVDGLIYENNYCDGSYDCGLDTHGAKNVIIRNNTVLNTVCAITAYNDNLRVKRPSGWTMDNILVENNYCESTKQISVGTEYPHPFVFLGSTNRKKESESPDNFATFNDFRNCIVRNNIFKTANNFADGAIFLDNFGKNIVLENNVFEFLTGANRYIVFRHSIGFEFKNNKSVGDIIPIVFFRQCFGEIAENIGFTYNYAVDAVSYIKGLQNGYGDTSTSPTFNMGDTFYNNGLKICNSYGLRARFTFADAIKTFSLTVTNGIATVDNNVYIPHLALSLTGDRTLNAYIGDVIDLTHFTLVSASLEPIADGTFTATIRDITSASI